MRKQKILKYEYTEENEAETIEIAEESTSKKAFKKRKKRNGKKK